MILTILLALLGILITLAVYHLQKNKASIKLKVELNEQPLDPSNPQYPKAVYMNSKSDRAIDIRVKVENQNNVPINIGPYVIGVPKFQRLQRIKLLSKIWRNSTNIPISKKNEEYKLMPREDPREFYKTGYEIAKILKEEGYSGSMYILFGLIDENKNNYYSQPVRINIEEWGNSRGPFLIM